MILIFNFRGSLLRQERNTRHPLLAIVKVLNRLHNQLLQMLHCQIIILALVRSLTAIVYMLVEGRIQILFLLLLRYLLHDHWLMSNQ